MKTNSFQRGFGRVDRYDFRDKINQKHKLIHFVWFILLSYSLHSPCRFQTHTNKTQFEQSRWLTMAGCLLLRARLAFGKAGERAPRPPLCTADSRLCMSEWAPSKPGPWPTAWLRSTWMASSKRSSNLLCYKIPRDMHINMTNKIQETAYKYTICFWETNDLNNSFLLYCARN